MINSRPTPKLKNLHRRRVLVLQFSAALVLPLFLWAVFLDDPFPRCYLTILVGVAAAFVSVKTEIPVVSKLLLASGAQLLFVSVFCLLLPLLHNPQGLNSQGLNPQGLQGLQGLSGQERNLQNLHLDVPHVEWKLPQGDRPPPMVAEVEGAPGAPGVPGAPGGPGAPGLPGVPDAPGAPGVPPDRKRLRAGNQLVDSESLKEFKWALLKSNFDFQNDWLADWSPAKYPDAYVSIVIACHNENEYLPRTILSIVNATSPFSLREIIVVDDASTVSMADSVNSYYATYMNDDRVAAHITLPEGLVRYVRSEVREGLIRSKRIGGDEATGDLIVFLDGHVKPRPNWLVYISREITAHQRRVVVPSIPILDGETWEEPGTGTGFKMMFDWDLNFHWFEDDTLEVPCMSGGLLAMSAEWWRDSGKLDDGMFMWGGENIEQSVRIWLAGGEIKISTDARVGHVFRSRFPYSVDHSKVLVNKGRTVSVWFDEYKAKVFERNRPVAQAVKNQDLSSRELLRQNLNSKSFKWYVEKFRNVFLNREMLDVMGFRIMTGFEEESLCLIPKSAVYGRVETAVALDLVLVKCDDTNPWQLWTHYGYDADKYVRSNFSNEAELAMKSWNPKYTNSHNSGKLLDHPLEYHSPPSNLTIQSFNTKYLPLHELTDSHLLSLRHVLFNKCLSLKSDAATPSDRASLGPCHSTAYEFNRKAPGFIAGFFPTRNKEMASAILNFTDSISDSVDSIPGAPLVSQIEWGSLCIQKSNNTDFLNGTEIQSIGVSYCSDSSNQLFKLGSKQFLNYKDIRLITKHKN